ncbi:YtxH domain-containing protein [Clostridium hydrogeniformans]|uniref:YtxH domain-containing protein n=1 Tax=Clostridium hydrogeniformans TaxID=349933 RepID=UPI000AE8C078|nr:YtxH domain-containing protein [Clostridium hydrogeniformans]
MRNGKFIVGMAAGAIVGGTVGSMMSNMDRRTKKKLRRTGKQLATFAEDVYSQMNQYMR